MIEQGTASMSMADVNQGGVGKKNAQRSTATDMSEHSNADDQPKRKHGIVEMTTYGVCGTLVLTALLSMALVSSSGIVVVAMSLGIANAVNAVRQRCILAFGGSLREIINRVRKDVNRLMRINVSLTENVNGVETEAKRLDSIEKNLQTALDERQTDMKTFMNLLKTNKETQEKMKFCIKEVVSQEIIEQVVRSDRDQDFIIDPEEIDMLLVRLGTLDGLDIDEARFRKKMEEKGSSLTAVIGVIRNLMENTKEEEEIFHIDVEEYKSHMR